MAKSKRQSSPPVKSTLPFASYPSIGRGSGAESAQAATPREAATSGGAPTDRGVSSSGTAASGTVAPVATMQTLSQSELRRQQTALHDDRRALEKQRQEAEAGFVAERAEILRGLETQLAALRAERAALLELLDDDLRKERAALDHALGEERQQRLEALAAELQVERRRHDGRIQTELDQLAADQKALQGEQVALRRGVRHLEAEQELLATDRTMFEARVERAAAARVAELDETIRVLTIKLDAVEDQRNHYFEQLEAHRTLEQALGGRPAKDLLAELDQLRRKNDELEQERRTLPSTAVLARAEELERERIGWQDQRAELEAALAREKAALHRHQASALELQQVRTLKEILESRVQLQEGALRSLQTEVRELTQKEENRTPFQSLVELDERPELQRPVPTRAPLEGGLRLGEFVTDLRSRMAVALKKLPTDPVLDYADADLRAWLAGLAMSRLILLQGISGTGKTSLPRAFAAAVGAGAVVVPVQAGWRDRQDLLGHYNAFHRKYYATEFLKALYMAGTPAYRDRPFFIVLDEINLSRVEQFFADFLSALELKPHEREIALLDGAVPNPPRQFGSGSTLRIPENVWFVGTANHDETTTAFADKTIDRAHVMELPRRGGVGSLEAAPLKAQAPLSYGRLIELFEECRRTHASEVTRAVSWLRETPVAGLLAEQFRVGWGNRLEDQAGRYVPVVLAAGGRVGEAMDHLFATRVLRKLMDRHDVRTEPLEAFRDQLVATWRSLDPAAEPKKCLAMLGAELRAKKGSDE